MTCGYGSKHYVGEEGLILLLAIGPLSSFAISTNAQILVKKPDDTEVEWEGTLITDHDSECAYIQYIIKEGDLDIPGEYELQAKAIVGGWSGLGETAKLIIYEEYT
jgi:hypothetical protein